MKNFIIGCIGIFFLFGVSQAVEKTEVKSESDRINYSIGYQIGGDFLRQGWKLQPDILIQGIRDAQNRTNPLMTPQQINSTPVNLKKKLEADQKKAAKAADAAFLVANAKKEGWYCRIGGIKADTGLLSIRTMLRFNTD